MNKRNNNEDMTFNNWLQAYISYEIIPGLTFRNEQQINIGNRFMEPQAANKV